MTLTEVQKFGGVWRPPPCVTSGRDVVFVHLSVKHTSISITRALLGLQSLSNINMKDFRTLQNTGCMQVKAVLYLTCNVTHSFVSVFTFTRRRLNLLYLWLGLIGFGSDLLRSFHYLTHHLQSSTVEAKICRRPDQLFPHDAWPAHLFAGWHSATAV